MSKLSEKQFKRVQELTRYLQAITERESEAGDLLEELDGILFSDDTEPTYSELTPEPPSPKTKTHGGAYIV
jgi:hypothetical protein